MGKWQREIETGEAGCMLALARVPDLSVRVVAREGEESSPGVRIPRGKIIVGIEYGSTNDLFNFMNAVADLQALVRKIR